MMKSHRRILEDNHFVRWSAKTALAGALCVGWSIASSSAIMANSPQPAAWFEILNGSGSFNDLAPLPNGELVAVGDLPGSTAILGTYDNSGAEQFVLNDDGSGFTGSVFEPEHVAVDASGNIVFTRRQNAGSSFPLDFNVIVTKLNSSGVVQWNTILDTPGTDTSDRHEDLEAMPDGSGYVVAGKLGGDQFDEAGWDASLTKLSSSGSIVWSKLYTDASLIGPGETFLEGEINDVVVTAQNDFLVLGNFIARRNGSIRVAYQRALRLNSNGDVIWQTLLRTYSAPSLTFFDTPLYRYRAAQLQGGSGSFAIVETGDGNRVNTLSSTGGLGSWSQSYEGTIAFNGAITGDADGGFSVAYFSDVDGNYGLYKFQANGSLSWTRVYREGTDTQQIISMVRTSDGGYGLAGFNSGSSGDAPLILKLDSDGGFCNGSVTTYEAENLTRTSGGASTSLNNAGNGVNLNADGIGDWIEFTLPNVDAGEYILTVNINKFANAGQAQASVEGNDAGGLIDFYNGGTSSDPFTVGTVNFTSSGNNIVRFTVKTKQFASSGYKLGFNNLTLTSIDRDSGTPSTAYYRLASKAYNRWLKTDAATSYNAFIAPTSNTGDATRWSLEDPESGYYRVVSKAFNRFLQGKNASGGYEAVSVPNSSTGTWTRWRLIDAGGDYHRLDNKAHGRWLQGKDSSDNWNCVITSTSSTGDSTRWKLVPAN